MARQAQGLEDAQQHTVLELDRRLADIRDLEDRLVEIGRSAPGPIVFSTSLGLEDQAILHAIARLAPRSTSSPWIPAAISPRPSRPSTDSEQRYGLRIRVIAPDAADVEELVARDGVFGFRLSVEAPQGLLRRAQGSAPEARAGGGRQLDHRAAARPIGRPRQRALRGLGRGPPPGQDQPAGGLVARTSGSLHRRQRRSGQPAARARLPLHRLPAVHARDPARRGRAAPGAGGGRARTARNAGCTPIRGGRAAEAVA